jgi:hypothetical protein
MHFWLTLAPYNYPRRRRFSRAAGESVTKKKKKKKKKSKKGGAGSVRLCHDCGILNKAHTLFQP